MPERFPTSHSSASQEAAPIVPNIYDLLRKANEIHAKSLTNGSYSSEDIWKLQRLDALLQTHPSFSVEQNAKIAKVKKHVQNMLLDTPQPETPSKTPEKEQWIIENFNPKNFFEGQHLFTVELGEEDSALILEQLSQGRDDLGMGGSLEIMEALEIEGMGGVILVVEVLHSDSGEFDGFKYIQNARGERMEDLGTIVQTSIKPWSGEINTDSTAISYGNSQRSEYAYFDARPLKK